MSPIVVAHNATQKQAERTVSSTTWTWHHQTDQSTNPRRRRKSTCSFATTLNIPIGYDSVNHQMAPPWRSCRLQDTSRSLHVLGYPKSDKAPRRYHSRPTIIPPPHTKTVCALAGPNPIQSILQQIVESHNGLLLTLLISVSIYWSSRAPYHFVDVNRVQTTALLQPCYYYIVLQKIQINEGPASTKRIQQNTSFRQSATPYRKKWHADWPQIYAGATDL